MVAFVRIERWTDIVKDLGVDVRVHGVTCRFVDDGTLDRFLRVRLFGVVGEDGFFEGLLRFWHFGDVFFKGTGVESWSGRTVIRGCSRSVIFRWERRLECCCS